MLEMAQPPVESEQEPEEGDLDPWAYPEDEEFFVRPDAAGMEEAIGKFLDGLEGQERNGFEEMIKPIREPRCSQAPAGLLPSSTVSCRGVMRASCYPFDVPKRRFHGSKKSSLQYQGISIHIEC